MRRALAVAVVLWLGLALGLATSLPLALEHVKDEAGHLWNLGSSTYPPLWDALTAAVVDAVPGWRDAASRLPYVVVSIAAIGLLVTTMATLAGPCRPAAIAALLTLLTLAPWGWRATTEAVVVAAVAAAAGALVVYARRPSVPAALVATATTAAALLAKETTPLFLLVPTAWCAHRLVSGTETYLLARSGTLDAAPADPVSGTEHYPSTPSRRRRVAALLGLAAVLAAAAWIAWQLHYGAAADRGEGLAARILDRATTGPSAVGSLLGRLVFYPAWLAVPFAVPALVLARAGGVDRTTRWLLAAGLVPVAALMPFPVQEPEYVLPAVPFLALAAGRIADRAWPTSPDRRRVLAAALAAGLLLPAGRVAHDVWLLTTYATDQEAAFDELIAGWESACADDRGCVADVLTARRRGHGVALLNLALWERGVIDRLRIDAPLAGEFVVVLHGYEFPDVPPGACVVPEERTWFAGDFAGEPPDPRNAALFDRVAAQGTPLVQTRPGREGPPRATLCLLRRGGSP